ncbi:MAG: ROK family protein [Candidatus Pacearchaeota archaeon]
MVLSIDIGATNIRIAEVKDHKVTNKIKTKTPRTKNEIIKCLIELVNKYDDKKVICIGIAGFVKNAKIYGTPNMDLNGVNIKKILEKRFNSKVYLDNDANCAGLGELYYGHGKNKKNFVLLTLGTGIGGAVIINRNLYRGTGFAGEPGHMIIPEGIFEKISSGKKYQDLIKKYPNKKNKIIDKISKNLAVGILNISYILDPEIIILGGGFSELKDLIEKVRKKFHEMDIIKRKIPVVHAKLGDNAGLIGAALLKR